VAPGIFSTAYWSYEGGGADAAEALEAMWQVRKQNNLRNVFASVIDSSVRRAEW
jgi:hypothetical protein